MTAVLILLSISILILYYIWINTKINLQGQIWTLESRAEECEQLEELVRDLIIGDNKDPRIKCTIDGLDRFEISWPKSGLPGRRIKMPGTLYGGICMSLTMTELVRIKKYKKSRFIGFEYIERKEEK